MDYIYNITEAEAKKRCDKEYLTEDDINSVLKISDTALRGLLKSLKREKEGYERIAVIMQCMGGRLYGDS